MRGPNLTDDERHRIVCILFEKSRDYKHAKGTFKLLATQFQVDRRTIFEIWRKAKEQRQNGQPLAVNSKMVGKKGRQKMAVLIEQIKATSMGNRSTMLKLSKSIGVAKITIQTWIKEGEIVPHTSAIKPQLTADNKYLRLNFAISKLYFDRLLNALKFKTMDNIVHVDEKWFDMTQKSSRVYLTKGETHPYRSCKSKRFITKVMFMAIVSRPIYDENKALIFDGKIGLFPFNFQQPAQRRSRNREAGTLETKPVASINREVTKAMFMDKVLPAIKSKWPACASKTITIQQDNARPHIKSTDHEFVQAATSDGFNITLRNQPANSPDLNVLDLGFSRSIQSLQSTKPAATIDELVKNVTDAWEEEEHECLDDVWLSLQACMIGIMKRKGHNDYPLPHLKKQAQRRQGTQPRDLTVDDELVRECIQGLMLEGKETNLEQLISDMGIVLPN
ncbi:uncharacterized protein LOC141631814 [Silene latifolia]|uniref:uncharacterized protein LOC141631814 n=1 Tax=Silene latifolia TaxID=37657 RepID=UPI003D76D8A8